MVEHEGAEIRFDLIQREIEGELGRFKFAAIAHLFDKWGAKQMRQASWRRRRAPTWCARSRRRCGVSFAGGDEGDRGGGAGRPVPL